MIRLIVLISLGLHRVEEIVQRHAALAGQIGLALAALTFFGDRAGTLEIIQGEEFIARHRKFAEAADDDRRAWPGFLNHLAAIVEEAADSAVAAARQADIADAQRAVLNQHGGDGAEAFVDAAFDHAATRGSRWVGLEIHDLALQIENFDQFGNALAGGGAGADDFSFAAPFDRDSALPWPAGPGPCPDWRRSGRSYSAPRQSERPRPWRG